MEKKKAVEEKDEEGEGDGFGEGEEEGEGFSNISSEDDDEEEEEKSEFQNLYRGFSPSLSFPSSLSLPILTSPPSPSDFFSTYIVTRTPCILSFLPSEIDVSSFLTLERLREMAGDDEVEVERRGGEGGGEKEKEKRKKVEGKENKRRREVEKEKKDEKKGEEEGESEGDFGLAAGPKIRMKFSEILQSFEKKESKYYLSTQNIPLDPLGFPSSLFGPPLLSLTSLFPLSLPLFEGLVLNNVNIWMGSYAPPSPSPSPSLSPSPSPGTRSPSPSPTSPPSHLSSFSRPPGTSSGLHHDFHDNLYILLRGQKTFQLLPPSLLGIIPMYGNPRRVHSNGLIQYAGSRNMTRSDGVPMSALDRDHIESQMERASERMERVMEKIDIFQKRKGTGKGKGRKDVEKEKERERELEREREDAIEGVEAAEGVMEDYLEYELMRIEEGEGEGDGEGEGQGEGQGDDEGEGVGEEKGENDVHSPEKKRRKVSPSSSSSSSSFIIPPPSPSPSPSPSEGPDHFSRLSVSQLPAHFSSLSSPLPPLITCELKSGQMLYLPASWYHSVFSANDADFPDGCHVALNYWFYPPDGTSVELPYRDNLLAEMFQKKYGNGNGKSGNVTEKKKRKR